MAIPLCLPSITEREREAVLEVVASGRLSLGEKVVAFERAFGSYLGGREAVAVSSGTAGLQLAVRALGLAPGDEVLTTPFTFIATASVLCHERLTPVFCDIDPATLNVNPHEMASKITPRTRAILVVHVFGLVADMDPILALAAEHGLAVVEDACEALGATYGGTRAGCFGQSAVFGFYPNKQITTAEGGMIVADTPELADRFRRERNHGRGGRAMVFDTLGFNFRLNEFAAALGLTQLERLGEILAARRLRAGWYREAFEGVEGLTCMPGEPGRSPFVYFVRFSSRSRRERVRKFLQERGIETGIYFPPLHLEGAFRFLGHRRGDYPVCEGAAEGILALPFWTDMPGEAVRTVAAAVKEALAS